MKNRIHYLFVPLCLFFFGNLQTGWCQNFPLKVSILDESISLPNFWFTDYPFNPAVIVGTEYVFAKKRKHDWHLTGNLGYYYHKDWESAVFLNSEIGYRYHLKRWSISPKFGIGYTHAFSPKPTYAYADGTFKEVRDFGRPAFNASLTLEIAFKVTKRENSPEVFFTFMESLELPYTNYTGLHQFVGFGYKCYPFKKK